MSSPLVKARENGNASEITVPTELQLEILTHFAHWGRCMPIGLAFSAVKCDQIDSVMDI